MAVYRQAFHSLGRVARSGRDVAAHWLAGSFGCNSAACHGSFKGKGGFRLSLFGQSPESDHGAIHDGRIDLDSPMDSLLLIKPSGREKHGGGIRFREDSSNRRDRAYPDPSIRKKTTSRVLSLASAAKR